MTEIAERTLHGAQMHDHEGEAIHPGTLCFVRPNLDGPPGWHGRRCLAVYAGTFGEQPWLLLIQTDGIPDHEVGWDLRQQVSAPVRVRLGINRYVTSHRGWWATKQSAAFIERVAEPEHVVGDGGTGPNAVDPSVLSGLRTQLSEAQDREKAAVKALEDFKERVIAVGGDAAEENEWCGEYENIMARLGLVASQQYEVEVEITLRTKVTTYARSPAIAAQRVSEADWPTPDLEIESDYEMSFSSPEKTVRLTNS